MRIALADERVAGGWLIGPGRGGAAVLTTRENKVSFTILYRSRPFTVVYGRGFVGFRFGEPPAACATLILECSPPVWWLPRREWSRDKGRCGLRVGWLLFAVGGSWQAAASQCESERGDGRPWI